MNQIVYGILTMAACYVIACRIDKMLKGVTQPAVFWQHALLAVSVFGSWLMSFTAWADWSQPVLAFGVLQFFVFSVGRWRTEAPSGTVKPPGELAQEHWQHVAGGTKK